MKAVDTQTGEVVELNDDEQTAQAVKAGQYALVSDDGRIPVRLVNGMTGSIAADGAAEAFKAGSARPIDYEEQRKKFVREEAASQPGIAFLEGVARTITMGASDALAPASQKEGIAARRETNPVASGGGEVIGVFNPLGSGGLIARAGKSAAAKVAPVVRGVAGQGMGKAAGTVTMGVTEGALFGGGQGVSQLALSDDPVTVESVFAAVGGGMLDGAKWGAVGGLGGAGLEAGAGLAKRGLAKVASKAEVRATTSITDEALEFAAKAPPGRNPAADAAIRAEAKATKGAVAAEREAVDAARGQATAKAASEGDALLKAHAEEGAKVGGNFRGAYEQADSFAGQTLQYAEKTVAKIDDVAKREAILAEMAELRAARQSANEAVGVSRVEAATKKGAKGHQWAKSDAELADLIGAENSQAAAAVRRQEEATANLKMALDGKAKTPVDAVGRVGTRAPAPNPEVMMVEAFASVPTAKLDELVQTQARWESLISKETRQAAKMSHADSVIAAMEKTGLKATPAQLDEAVRAAGYGDVALSSLPKDAQKAIEAQFYSGIAKAHQKARAAAAKAAEAGSALSGLKGELVGAGIGLAANWMFDGALGPVLSGMLGAKLGSMVRGKLFEGVKGVLAGKASQVTEKAAKGVDAFLTAGQKASKFTPRTATAVLGSAALNPKDPEKPKGNIQELYQQQSKALVAALSDPQGTQEAIGANLSHATASEPMLGDQLAQMAMKRLQYLFGVMPKNPGVGSPMNQEEYKPSEGEVSKWARCIAAADDPIGCISDELKHNALTVETIQTVEALYPALFTQMRTDLIERTPQLATSLSWSQRLTLSTFFAVPVDSVCSPEKVAQLQATYVSEPAPEGPKPSRASSPKPEPTSAQRLSG